MLEYRYISSTEVYLYYLRHIVRPVPSFNYLAILTNLMKLYPRQKDALYITYVIVIHRKMTSYEQQYTSTQH